MESTIDELRDKAIISDETTMKLLSSRVLMDCTEFLLKKLQEEYEAKQDLPEDMSWLIGKYLKLLDQSIKHWNIDETVWRDIVRDTFQSLKDSCTLYLMVHDVSRTVSASLMLRYSNVAYSLSYSLQNDDEAKNEIIESFLRDKEELKQTVQSLNGLEDKEMQELNRWDSHLDKLLKNDGKPYKLIP